MLIRKVTPLRIMSTSVPSVTSSHCKHAGHDGHGMRSSECRSGYCAHVGAGPAYPARYPSRSQDNWHRLGIDTEHSNTPGDPEGRDPREPAGARSDEDVGGVGRVSGKTPRHGWPGRPRLIQQQQRHVVLQLLCRAGERRGYGGSAASKIGGPPSDGLGPPSANLLINTVLRAAPQGRRRSASDTAQGRIRAGNYTLASSPS